MGKNVLIAAVVSVLIVLPLLIGFMLLFSCGTFCKPLEVENQTAFSVQFEPVVTGYTDATLTVPRQYVHKFLPFRKKSSVLITREKYRAYYDGSETRLLGYIVRVGGKDMGFFATVRSKDVLHSTEELEEIPEGIQGLVQ